jgi:hypothetical protein
MLDCLVPLHYNGETTLVLFKFKCHFMKLYTVALVVICLVQVACKKEETALNSSSTAIKNSPVTTTEKFACPLIDPSNFTSNITNPYFPLSPGTVFQYVNRIVDGVDTTYEHIVVTVSTKTQMIAGVQCREVHDLVTVNGAVTENTLDWYAQDKTGNVWYFGEHSKSLKDKNGSTTEGSWKAGERNACPGIIMWADLKSHLNEIYYQEFLPGTAEDQAQVISTNNTVSVPYGTFNNCLKTKEFSNLEPGVIEFKYYATNVGLLKTEMTSGGNELEVLTAVTH